MFEDTNPSGVQIARRCCSTRLIPGCQLQTRDAQRRADGQLVTRASNGFRPLVQHVPFSQIQIDIANSIQLRAAPLEQRCQQLTIWGFAKRLCQFFHRLVHGALEQLRYSPGSQADHIMQATEVAVAESLAAILRPDAVAVRLDHDETLVPY